MIAERVLIARRFRGPPDSGNGGYVAGILARHIDGPAEITLRAPIPLDRSLDLRAFDDGLKLNDGETRLAEVTQATGFELDVPFTPSWDQAVACSRHGGSGGESEFHQCFVCGAGRASGDGLRVLAQHIPAHDDGPAMSLAAWQPHSSFAGSDGLVPPEFLWSALDCPGATAVLGEDDQRIVLTGRIAGSVEHLPKAGQRCIVIGWSLGGAGRKLYSGTAVIDADGQVLARARTTWIVVRNG